MLAEEPPIKIKTMKVDHDDLCIVPGCGRHRNHPSRYCRVHDFKGCSE